MLSLNKKKTFAVHQISIIHLSIAEAYKRQTPINIGVIVGFFFNCCGRLYDMLALNRTCSNVMLQFEESGHRLHAVTFLNINDEFFKSVSGSETVQNSANYYRYYLISFKIELQIEIFQYQMKLFPLNITAGGIFRLNNSLTLSVS